MDNNEFTAGIAKSLAAISEQRAAIHLRLRELVATQRTRSTDEMQRSVSGAEAALAAMREAEDRLRKLLDIDFDDLV
jgi:Arc/MetJ family transcription regulator